MILGIDIHMAEKDKRYAPGLTESRNGPQDFGSAKRFPKEQGEGEGVLGHTERCNKQDRKKPAHQSGLRYSKPMSSVYAMIKNPKTGKKVLRKVGNRINANQYCNPCGQPKVGKDGKKKSPKYYEYRRNRADVDRSARYKKQRTSPKRRYSTRKRKK
ncbi:MAG: hypothetical protein AMQ22_00579 [Candidatus Methanofastidiosum methylothiophilum]|uniref:Uncharacterized protein n=1 Tax=Candidatus Methanofastidiosum methylothiophilum TaxID=1705564 RepID=A0A150J6S3_9EURY|nr:MAG: hypothetical protein AMQ22_00579 [Candidatus Methanofastidiosum methylthiophilus]